ncbi:MAG: cysteine hydrolase [Chloroflexi bacterium]|nr:cysteine hydrolase [Chloroflexota bacterium]
MTPSSKTILEEWPSVAIPPPPAWEPVSLPAKGTALLVLDLQNQNCSLERRPRCVATLQGVAHLLDQARTMGATVIYSLTRGASREDVRPEVAPLTSEPAVASGVDKFYNTQLEALLRERGIETVIIVGTSAHGAVLHTATAAALREFRVVVPVDGMSAEDPFAELYTAWHLANAPGTRGRVTLTKLAAIHFIETEEGS